MKELQIPTRPLAVEVFLDTGSPVRGFLYHTDTPFREGGSADVAEVLNDERAFVPFRSGGEDGTQMILNKEHIVRVRVEDPEDWSETEEHADAVGEWDDRPRTLVLADGARVCGQIAFETPPTAARLLDKLNLAPVFVPVRTADGTELVRRSHIVRVE